MRRIKVVAVIGSCNAGFESGDTFHLDGLRIIPQNSEKICWVAFASIIANASRWKLQNGSGCISCPDPATGIGGNVIFELSPEEDYENHQH